MQHRVKLLLTLSLIFAALIVRPTAVYAGGASEAGSQTGMEAFSALLAEEGWSDEEIEAASGAAEGALGAEVTNTPQVVLEAVALSLAYNRSRSEEAPDASQIRELAGTMTGVASQLHRSGISGPDIARASVSSVREIAAAVGRDSGPGVAAGRSPDQIVADVVNSRGGRGGVSGGSLRERVGAGPPERAGGSRGRRPVFEDMGRPDTDSPVARNEPPIDPSSNREK